MNPLITAVALVASLSIAQAVTEQCGWGYPRNSILDQPFCLDDNAGSDPSSWAPWTHKPYCIEAADTPWCVFTNAVVPYGGEQHGMSIITTPDLASDTFNLLGRPLEQAFRAIPPEKRFHTPPPYEVRDVPGKGKGAIATRKIEKGKVILIDHAIVLATVEFPADVTREEVQDLMKIGVQRLSDPGRVYELSQKGRDEEEGMSLEEDLILTNAFELPIEDKSYLGLFQNLARINHACNPNAHLHFSETTLAMTIWSARDIEPGEEITISYYSVELTRAERQEALKDIWGFNCACSLCAADEKTRKASDARRVEFRALRNKVLELAQENDFDAAIKKTEKLFRIVEEEELAPHIGDLYEIPARLYYQIGDLEKAREYLKLSMHELDGWGVPGGNDIEKLRVQKGVLRQLEGEIEQRKKAKGKQSQ